MNSFPMIFACAIGQRHTAPEEAKCQGCGEVEPIIGPGLSARYYVCATCAVRGLP